MKKILFFLLLVFTADVSRAAIASTAVWAVNSSGASTGGGAFNPSNANFLTDFTATSATSTAPVISTASYNFVAGDVGAWIYVSAGTNWIPGRYKISSVAANAATVDATIGHAEIISSGGVYSPSTVQGCATTASPTAGTCGVDFSTLTAARYSPTDLASVGSSTTLTSATAGFTRVMVGNYIQQTTTGTGAFGVIGWYEIVSYNSTSSVVTDRTTNNGTAEVAVTGFVGGAVSTIGKLGSASTGLGVVAGNQVFVTGSFTMTSTTDTIAVSGTGTNLLQMHGFSSVRGDGFQGHTNTNGPLVTTNFPTITYTTGRATFTGGAWIIECINWVGAPSNPTLQVVNNTVVKRCKITNSSTNGSAAGFTCSTNGETQLFDSDVALTGASGGNYAVSMTGVADRINGCRITGGPNQGVVMASSVTLLNTLVYKSTGIQVNVNATAATVVIDHCTIVGGTTDGITFLTGLVNANYVVNCMITDNGGYGINGTDAGALVFNSFNRFRGNTSGNINNATAATNASSDGNQTTGSGTSSDYVNYASNDFNLISTSVAVGNAWPAPSSMGALQRSSTSAGSTSYGYTH